MKPFARACAPWTLVAALAAAPVAPAAAAPNEARDVAAIQQVVERFRTAILAKDKPGFLQLFFSPRPGEVTWQFVVDDARLARVQRTMPQARKARRVPEVNHVSFIDAEVAPDAPPGEEQFRDVRIDTDGEIASVAFDYTYLQAGAATNHGREMWQLVRTESGWKIISVIFSVRDPQPAPRP